MYQHTFEAKYKIGQHIWCKDDNGYCYGSWKIWAVHFKLVNSARTSYYINTEVLYTANGTYNHKGEKQHSCITILESEAITYKEIQKLKLPVKPYGQPIPAILIS